MVCLTRAMILIKTFLLTFHNHPSTLTLTYYYSSYYYYYYYSLYSMYMIPTIKKKEHLQSVANHRLFNKGELSLATFINRDRQHVFPSHLSIKSSLGLIKSLKKESFDWFTHSLSPFCLCTTRGGGDEEEQWKGWVSFFFVTKTKIDGMKQKIPFDSHTTPSFSYAAVSEFSFFFFFFSRWCN